MLDTGCGEMIRADPLEFEKGSWEPHPFGGYDIDIEIECCGVCASDRHTITGDWGDCPYPLVVGHEVVGKVLRVGSRVTLAKASQRVGCGAKTYCKDQIDAYSVPCLNTGYTTYGGYSSHTPIDEYCTEAAPMLCAGITVYSSLKRLGAGPGKKVGIAMGDEVWAMSRCRAKKADAKKMGADGYLATGERNWTDNHKMTFDIIINTTTSFEGLALSEYLGLWISQLGSRREMLEMFQLAADKGIKSWVGEILMSREGLQKAMDKLKTSSLRYRTCMTNYKEVVSVKICGLTD
ncbi:chaperonin 10-like protein [Mariannaea sp. PMI_226]|nr:chaperonin 10-like protein [Mariannaea sp. PMI_226]